MPYRLSLGLVAMMVLLSWTVDAFANCSRPATYSVTSESGRLVVCPSYYGDRGCPDPGGMLREDLATGEVVRLPDRCEPDEYGDSCYVDLCVKSGRYRYGFADPFDCTDGGCYTDYYSDDVGSAGPPAGCVIEDALEPVVYSQGAPWGDSQRVCNGVGGYDEDNEELCSLTGLATAPTVLGFNLFVFIVGAAAWLVQRRRS